MKTSKFQIVLIGIFSLAIVVGLIVMSLSRGRTGPEVVRLVLWGTADQTLFDSFIHETFAGDKTVSISYIQKSKSAFDQALVEAIADGIGPDIVLLPGTSILRYANKLYPISYSDYPARTFKDTFVQESEMFMLPQGIIAFPWSIDPMVMYWNRDIFGNAGISNPPRYWD